MPSVVVQFRPSRDSTSGEGRIFFHFFKRYLAVTSPTSGEDPGITGRRGHVAAGGLDRGTPGNRQAPSAAAGVQSTPAAGRSSAGSRGSVPVLTSDGTSSDQNRSLMRGRVSFAA